MELQWSTHQALVVWVGVVCSSPGRRLTFSENPGKILGNSRARRKILGVTGREFRGILGILHHQTASFAGAPITTREKAGSQSGAAARATKGRQGGRWTTRRVLRRGCEGYRTRVPHQGRYRAGEMRALTLAVAVRAKRGGRSHKQKPSKDRGGQRRVCARPGFRNSMPEQPRGTLTLGGECHSIPSAG
jgi:hypothetical protein